MQVDFFCYIIVTCWTVVTHPGCQLISYTVLTFHKVRGNLGEVPSPQTQLDGYPTPGLKKTNL